MRLRTVAAIAAVLAAIGGGIWMYGSNSGGTTAIGAGGLPLIKADANPVKVPPEDDGSDIIPNADSTVFAAMGTEAEADPSMENINPPAEENANSSADFAGFRTGFALPREPERKTESLFDEKEKSEAASGGSKYFSGIAPDAVSADTEETPPAKAASEPLPEPIAEPEAAPVKAEKPKKAEPAPEQEERAETAPKAPVEEEVPSSLAAEPLPPDNIAAQALEAQEKILVTPTAKPPVPKLARTELKAEPEKKPEKAPEKTMDEPFNPVALAEKAEAEQKAASPTPAPKQTVPDVHPITPPVKTETVAQRHYIQLSSVPKGADTASLWNTLKSRNAAALAGLSPSYQEAEIPGKGAFVRIQAGPMSKEEAESRCKKLREQNPSGGCLVLRR